MSQSEFKGGDDGDWLVHADYVNEVPELIKTQAREYVHLVKDVVRRLPAVYIRVPTTNGKGSLISEKMLEQLSSSCGLALDPYPINKNTLPDLMAIHSEAYNEIDLRLFPLDHNVKIPRYKRVPHMQRAESKRGGPRGWKY